MKPKTDHHPKQELSGEIVAQMMRKIRGQFCGDVPPKQWAQDFNWIRKNVVLWPAHFICNRKHFTLPPGRYVEIMQGIFDDIKSKGNTAAVRYWPGYLMKCVQDHWQHHWEDYYTEAKAVRNLALHTMANLGTVKPEDKTVDVMAMAQRSLNAHRNSGRKPAKKQPDNDQLTMF
ncbi:MAG TPA: hypothetical protein VGO57_17975 [Verrucomicrobiae bacterium]|jgi:hypothetical protein